MNIITRQAMVRVVCLLIMVVAYSTTSQAGVILPTVVLPPLSGAYTLGGTCLDVLGRCTQNAMVSGFSILGRTVVSGDEVVEVSASYSADVFTNSGGVPGVFLGHLSLLGTAQFLYVGRDPAVNPLGTFTTELTDFGFSGTLNGNTFELKRNPAHTSAGSTTIVPTSLVPPFTFDVSGSLEIFGMYSFNGSPFVPAPPRTAVLTPAPAVPEPGSLALLGMGLVTIGGRVWRRRGMR